MSRPKSHLYDTIAYVINHWQIMSNKENSQVLCFRKAFKQMNYLRLSGNIKSGERLIGNYKIGVSDKGTVMATR